MKKTKIVALSITLAILVTLVVPLIITKIVTKEGLEDKKTIQSTKLITYSNISVNTLKNYIETKKDIYLLDVHIPEQEHIGTTDAFIPFNDLIVNASKLPLDKETEIVIYCRSGSMSETASNTLTDMGYTNVKNLKGGLNAWKAAGFSL